MILRKETFEQFGYDPEQLKPYSNKNVVIACDICGAVRIIQKSTYRPFCRSCAQKGRKHSEETKKKISESQKGEKNHSYGKHLTEERKRKLSEANKGKIVSEVTRRKLGDAARGRHHSEETKRKLSIALSGENSPNYGRKHSDETKRKRSDSVKKAFEEGRISINGEKNPFWGKHHSEETKEKLREARKKQRFPMKDTKPELIFIDFYNKFDIADRVKDTRDNSFHIGRLNPDFIIRDMRIAIFVNGDYWHSALLRPRLRDTNRPEVQVKVCKKHKWKAIILWESDLLREDAKEFVFNILHEYGVI